MGSLSRKPKSLTVQRSFVVELHDDADVTAGRVTGRIEHVVTGRAARFADASALFQFMAEALAGSPAEPDSAIRKRRKRRC